MLLIMKPKVASIDFRPMYITLGCIILCTILDRMETAISDMPQYYTQRLTLSILCYWLRPAFCLGLIYVIVTERKKRLLIAIPELVNIVVMGAAGIPVIGKYVFYFDDGFGFKRGPLGITVFVVGFVYIIYLFYLVFFRMKIKQARETWLIAVGSISIFLATILETGSSLSNVSPTLVVASCLVYYLCIYIQLTSVDALTGLYNRANFYVDMKNRHITAMISLDMNGLKILNDSQGHKAGDAALAAIGAQIARNAGLTGRGYRIGGDEFAIILKNTREAEVIKICDKIKNCVEQAGYSVAIGYAFAQSGDPEQLLALSDQRMYEDKDLHYGGGRNRK